MFVAANKGSYVAQAGMSNHLQDAFEIVSAFSPNPGKIQQSGMKAKSAKYIADVQNEAKKNYYKTVGQSTVGGIEQLASADKYTRDQKKFAGGLATLGAFAYAGGKYLRNKDNTIPEPVARPMIDNSELIEGTDDFRSKLDEARKNLEELTGKPVPKVGDYLDGGSSTKPVDGGGSTGTSGDVPSGTDKPTVSSFKPFDDLDSQAFGIIQKYEGGEWGFDAVNQGGTKDGTKIPEGFYSGSFSNMKQHGGKKLTDLSLQEIIDLQSNDGSLSNAEWVNQGKLHAVGGYQFIGNTFKEEVQKSGLDLSTKFTPDIQKGLAKQLAVSRGGIKDTTWIGLKKMTPEERAVIDQWNSRL